MWQNMREFIKTDYDEINLLIDLLRIAIKEVNQAKDIELISACTRFQFVASVFRIYYACQTDAQPDTRVLLFFCY